MELLEQVDHQLQVVLQDHLLQELVVVEEVLILVHLQELVELVVLGVVELEEMRVKPV